MILLVGGGGVLFSTKIRPQYETTATVLGIQLLVNHLSYFRTLQIAANALIPLTD